MPRKRTLKSYIDLFRDPRKLFPPSADSLSPEVILFPNGKPGIWIKGTGGKGFAIDASEGPAGLSIRISTFIGSPPITISGNAAGDYAPIHGLPDARHLSLCQYNRDEKSQAFKRWYQSDAAGRGNLPEFDTKETGRI